VIPIALQGLWGSFFSHYGGTAMRSWTQRFRAKVTLNIGVPMAPEVVSAEQLYLAVKELRGANT